MARKARLRSNNQIYHVMLRGNDMQDIFIDDEDKNKMMQILKDKKQGDAFFIYAFCILSNHFHLLIREGNDDITRILKRVATSYAYYFNKKHNRIGHVFHDRFKSETVSDDCCMAVISYIHRDPARVMNCPLDEFVWSSYSEYVGKSNKRLTDCGEIFDMFNKDRSSAISDFVKFHLSDAGEGFLDIIEEKEIDRENVNQYINIYLKESALSIGDLKKPESKKVRESVILYLLNSSNLSRRSIAEILGINRETVRKAGLIKEPSS